MQHKLKVSVTYCLQSCDHEPPSKVQLGHLHFQCGQYRSFFNKQVSLNLENWNVSKKKIFNFPHYTSFQNTKLLSTAALRSICFLLAIMVYSFSVWISKFNQPWIKFRSPIPHLLYFKNNWACLNPFHQIKNSLLMTPLGKPVFWSAAVTYVLRFPIFHCKLSSALWISKVNDWTQQDTLFLLPASQGAHQKLPQSKQGKDDFIIGPLEIEDVQGAKGAQKLEADSITGLETCSSLHQGLILKSDEEREWEVRACQCCSDVSVSVGNNVSNVLHYNKIMQICFHEYSNNI